MSKLSLYLQPTGTSGQQSFEGVIYAESGGAPGALLGSTSPLTFTSTSPAGWYDLSFPTALKLAAGNYWIGFISGGTAAVAAFRYDSVASALDYNANTFTSGPSNPFGTPTPSAADIALRHLRRTACQHLPAHDLRHRAAGPDAHREPRRLDE